LTAALGVRLLGLWHGYPYSFYPDEAHYVKRALSFGSGDFNPHWFNKPAFFMYILFFEYGVYFIVGKILQFWQSAEDFAIAFIANPGPFYLIGRLTVTAFSVGSIFITYRLGERHIRPGVGLLAALLLTVSFGHVVTSHDIKGDVPAMFFTILSALFMMEYLLYGKPRQLLLAVIAAAMGSAVKYYSVVMLGPIGLAVLFAPGQTWRYPLQHWRSILGWWLLIPLLFLVGFFVCAPFNFLDPLGRQNTFGRFFELWHVLFPAAADATAGAPPPNRFITETMSRPESVIDYGRVLLHPTGMGVLVGGLCLLGTMGLLLARRVHWYLLLFFPIFFFLVSSVVYPGYSETRHQLPIYPFLALGGGYLLVCLADRIPATYRGLSVAALLLMLALPIHAIVQNGLFIARQDTRVVAEQWIEQNIAPGTRLFVAEKGPNLSMTEAQLDALYQKAREADPDGAFTANYATYLRYQKAAAAGQVSFLIEQPVFPWWREKEPENGIYELTEWDRNMGNTLQPIGIRSLEDYLSEDIEYFVINSIRYEPLLNPQTQRHQNWPSYVKFYRELLQRGSLVKEFPQDRGRPGPTIKILQIRDIPQLLAREQFNTAMPVGPAGASD